MKDILVKQVKKGKARFKGKPIPDPPIDDEIFEANLEMKYSWDRWIEKINFKGEPLKSTFFPKNWSKERILDEIGFAWDNKKSIDVDGVFFEGNTTNGIKINFIFRNNEITTVYPIK